MTLLIDNLCKLATRQNSGRRPTMSDMQRSLKPGLVTVIRRALRSGGDSPVAHWLTGELGLEPGSEQAVGSDPNELASMLCKEIECHLQFGSPRLADPLAETIIEERRLDHPCRV